MDIFNCNMILPLRQSLRVLYVSHTGMTEPLGHSQVIPYVEGLARAGFLMEIMAFEPERATLDERSLLAEPFVFRTELVH